MALTPRLDIRQTQALVLTPQLQQAIKLLQMSSQEVAEFVEAEIEQNPLLDRDEAPEGGDVELGEPDAGGEAAEPAPRDSVDFAEADTMPAAADEPLDTDYESMGTDDAGDMPYESGFAGRGGRRNGFDDEGSVLEQTVRYQPTLREHLLQQLGVDVPDPTDRLIGLHLIDSLDESGRLSDGWDAIAGLLNCEPERVAKTLERLQRFDPPGVFARDLVECWALQLRDRDRLDPAMRALLDNLDLWERRDIEKLKRICGVDAEDLKDMVAEIRGLNPRPASAFDHEVVQSITPDVIMRPSADGGWRVELNPETLPRVLVNRHYYAEVSRDARTPADREYLAERLHSANWLVKALHQRANTILKVASEIVRQQDAFFAHGVKRLKPLVLRHIAVAIEMHESTVSRVTSNKFMATPRGVYELKYFFTAAIASCDGGSAHSAEAVRFRIKALIDAEPPDGVLSDDRIVATLRADGVEIARRTVAKYREAMRIPASVQRRREKTISL